MARFIRQFSVLFWKNWLTRLRQPVLSLSEIIWPCLLFLILLGVRVQHSPLQRDNCYVEPRTLPNGGLYPFIQSIFCDIGSSCHNVSFTEARDIAQRSRSSLSLTVGSGSDLLITIEELGKQINGTIQQASNLQIKINELLGPTGESANNGSSMMALNEMETITSIIERIHNETYTWEILFNLPNLLDVLMNEDFLSRGIGIMAEMLMNLKRLLESVKDLISPSDENIYLDVDATFNLTISAMDVVRYVYPQVMKLDLKLMDILWNRERIKSIFINTFKLDPKDVELLMNMSINIYQFPVLQNVRNFQSYVDIKVIKFSGIPRYFSRLVSNILFASIDRLKIMKQIFYHLENNGVVDFLATKFDEMLAALIRPLTFNQDLNTTTSMQQTIYLIRNITRLTLQFKNNASSEELQKYQDNLESMPQWPWIKKRLILDKLFRDHYIEQINFEKDIFLLMKKVYFSVGVNDVSRIIMDADTLISEMKSNRTKNVTITCSEIVLKMKDVLNLPEKLFLNNTLTSLACEQDLLGFPWRTNNFLKAQNIWLDAIMNGVQPEFDITVVDMYKGWQEVFATYDSYYKFREDFFSSFSENVTINSELWKNVEFSTLHQNLLWNLVFDMFAAHGSAMESSDCWPGIEKYVRAMCWVIESSNQPLEGNGCDEGKINWRNLLNETLIFVQNAQNDYGTWQKWFLNAMLKFLNRQSIIKLSADDIQIISQIFNENNTMLGKIQGLQSVAKIILENTQLWMSNNSKTEANTSSIMDTLFELIQVNNGNFNVSKIKVLMNQLSKGQPSEFVELSNIVLSALEKGIEDATISNPFQDQINKFNAMWSNLQKILYNSTVLSTKGLNFFWNFTSSLWIGSTEANPDYVEVAKMFLQYLNNLGLLPQEQLSSVMDAISTSKNVAVNGSSTQNLTRLQAMELQLFRVLEAMDRENKTQLLETFYNMIQAVLTMSNATDLHSLVTAFGTNSEDVFIFLEEFSADDIGEALETVAKIIAVFRNMSKDNLAENVMKLYLFAQSQVGNATITGPAQQQIKETIANLTEAFRNNTNNITCLLLQALQSSSVPISDLWLTQYCPMYNPARKIRSLDNGSNSQTSENLYNSFVENMIISLTHTNRETALSTLSCMADLFLFWTDIIEEVAVQMHMDFTAVNHLRTGLVEISENLNQTSECTNYVVKNYTVALNFFLQNITSTAGFNLQNLYQVKMNNVIILQQIVHSAFPFPFPVDSNQLQHLSEVMEDMFSLFQGQNINYWNSISKFIETLGPIWHLEGPQQEMFYSVLYAFGNLDSTTDLSGIEMVFRNILTFSNSIVNMDYYVQNLKEFFSLMTKYENSSDQFPYKASVVLMKQLMLSNNSNTGENERGTMLQWLNVMTNTNLSDLSLSFLANITKVPIYRLNVFKMDNKMRRMEEVIYQVQNLTERLNNQSASCTYYYDIIALLEVMCPSSNPRKNESFQVLRMSIELAYNMFNNKNMSYDLIEELMKQIQSRGNSSATAEVMFGQLSKFVSKNVTLHEWYSPIFTDPQTFFFKDRHNMISLLLSRLLQRFSNAPDDQITLPENITDVIYNLTTTLQSTKDIYSMKEQLKQMNADLTQIIKGINGTEDLDAILTRQARILKCMPEVQNMTNTVRAIRLILLETGNENFPQTIAIISDGITLVQNLTTKNVSQTLQALHLFALAHQPDGLNASQGNQAELNEKVIRLIQEISVSTNSSLAAQCLPVAVCNLLSEGASLNDSDHIFNGCNLKAMQNLSTALNLADDIKQLIGRTAQGSAKVECLGSTVSADVLQQVGCVLQQYEEWNTILVNISKIYGLKCPVLIKLQEIWNNFFYFGVSNNSNCSIIKLRQADKLLTLIGNTTLTNMTSAEQMIYILSDVRDKVHSMTGNKSKSVQSTVNIMTNYFKKAGQGLPLNFKESTSTLIYSVQSLISISDYKNDDLTSVLNDILDCLNANINLIDLLETLSTDINNTMNPEMRDLLPAADNIINFLRNMTTGDFIDLDVVQLNASLNDVEEILEGMQLMSNNTGENHLKLINILKYFLKGQNAPQGDIELFIRTLSLMCNISQLLMGPDASGFNVYPNFLPYIITVLSNENINQSVNDLQNLNDFLEEIYLDSDLPTEFQQVMVYKVATILNQLLPMNQKIPMNYTDVTSNVLLQILEIDFNGKGKDSEFRQKTLKLMELLKDFLDGMHGYDPMKDALGEAFGAIKLFFNSTEELSQENIFTSLEAMCQFEWFGKYLTLQKSDLLQLKLLNLLLEKRYFVNDVICIQKECQKEFGSHQIHIMTELFTFMAEFNETVQEVLSAPVPEGCLNYINYQKQIQIAVNQTHEAMNDAMENYNCQCESTQSLNIQLIESFEALCQIDFFGNHLKLMKENLYQLKFQNLYSEKLYLINDIACAMETCKGNITGNIFHAVTELLNFTTDIKAIIDEVSTPTQNDCESYFNYYKQVEIASNQTKQRIENALMNQNCQCDVTPSLTKQLYERFKYAVRTFGQLSSNSSTMIALENLGTFQDLHIESCVQNITTLKTQLQQISNISFETIDALLRANVSLSELILRTHVTTDRCDEKNMARMLSFPAGVNTSAVAAQICSLSFWDRHKFILTISRGMDVRCFIYKAFLPLMIDREANQIIQSILEIFSDIGALASKSLQFLDLVPKLLESVRNMNLPSLFEIDEPVQARSRASTPSSIRNGIFKGICKTKSNGLFDEGLPFSDLPPIEKLTEEDYIKYKIPTNTTPYCRDFYEDILKAPSGPLLWTFMKPLLLGYIPYSPSTPEILTLIDKADGILDTVESLKIYSEVWLKAVESLSVPETPMLNELQATLQNDFVRNFIESQTDTNVEDLLKALQDYEIVKNIIATDPVAKEVTILSELMINVSSCISIKRFIPLKSKEDLEEKVIELMADNTFLAGVIFDYDNDGNTSRRARSLSSPVPSRLKYTIRTNILHSMSTDLLENPKWISQPKSIPTESRRYNLIFIPLQDMIERAFIEVQTGQDISSTAVQVAAMPYPCHKNDQFLNNIGFFLPLLMMLAWLISMASLVRRLVFEKELRLEEYMKILGVKPVTNFLVWFLDNFIILIISSAAITIILKAGHILPNSNGFIVFLYFVDFGASVISLGYLISAFFSHANTAALSACLLYIITFFPYMVFVVVQNQLNFSSQILICLLCTTAFSQGAYIITLFEGEGPGIQWNNMYEVIGSADNVSFAWVCWMIVIDSVIYLILGWYLHNIFPGKCGTRRPWYFPFTSSYWMNLHSCAKRHDRKIGEGYWAQNLNNYNQQMNAKEDPLDYMNLPVKEAKPNKLEIGVAVRSLTKTYRHNKKVAVSDLNLDFYKGEITALLGPNGAGKTTTMSMLTGLHQPSSGVIYVNGKNMNRDLSVIREELGVCLQHDVLFESLTVHEHLVLYGVIKAPRWTKQKLLEEVNIVLDNAGIRQYQNKCVSTLSGGTKRKLSLAIAFIGGSSTVILDEPTSGIDPCSRRNIWDIILKYREGRTIIFTTHHLDEADVLSDRIVILENGQLKCCGSPSYLKEVHGHGYSLVMSKKPSAAGSRESCDVGLVTSLVKEHTPQAFLKENAFGNLTYVIPTAEDKTAYENLLHALDENMENLHLSSYSISDTTLEEVFMNLLQNEANSVQDHDQDSESLKSESIESTGRDSVAFVEDPRVTGIKLIFSQMAALMIKRFHHTRRDWKGAIANLLLPVLFVILAMALFSVKPLSSEYPSLRMSPDMYHDSDVTFFSSDKMDYQNLTAKLLKSFNINEPCTGQASNWNNVPCWRNGPSNPQYAMEKCKCDQGQQQCPATNTTVPHFRNNDGNFLYNLTGYNLERYLISTENSFGVQRLGGFSIGEEPPKDLKGNNLSQIDINSLVKVWYNQRGFHAEPALLNQLNNLILRANLPTDANWTDYGITLHSHPYRGALLNDDKILENLRQCGVAFCILLGFSILTASIGGYIVQDRLTGQKRLQHISGLGYRLYWITNFLCDMILYMVPVVLCICVFAAFQFSAFTYRANLGATSLLLILFGFATLPWMYLLSRFFTSSDTAFITYTAINLVLGLCTILATYLPRFLGLLSNNKNLLEIYNVLRWAFIIFPQFCLSFGLVELSYNQLQFDITMEFGIDSYMSPFKMEYLGWVFVAITLEGCFFIIIRLLFQGQLLHKLRCNNSLDAENTTHDDEDVKRECQRLQNGEANNDIIQIHNLKKSYRFLNKNVRAVRGISMGVPIGECFGLLGVNGAGKTTTFKMLTGDVGPSSGHATIRTTTGSEQDILGSSIDGTMIGYCPQYDALDGLLTGREHLYYYARIRGIPEKMINKSVNDLAQCLHLTFHVNEVVRTYSGGTKRKLSTALALIGRPQVILLDEPSSGMDPESKRFLWRAILSEVDAGCAAILTSHSMEECEALCSRLAIMVNGKFKCIGSPKHIKNRFGEVYTVKVVLSQKSTNSMELTELLMSHFPGTTLKEEHQYSLEYQVPQKDVELAKMFHFLENNKEQLNIKHYSISQATLDQVFINFARQFEERLDQAPAEINTRNPYV
ncbi:ATP-binding cassette sub-family A member 13-like isoform X2 [Leucoraja erinacea]|uniref:ATP-binding cassette sub-family A member 13-like isoform X2 n=1 Tax=Leucoraja erinaceus TaxID=7782 RepID=UPI002454BE87|nr:ATP-binding cassette sub-family A member 13-like isoform X2 [Leucoraja erinacea]